MTEITFAASPVPMKVASKVLGMKPDTIRNQMERGMLQIGVISPAKHKRGKRAYRNTYISPKLFYELTGYVWKGEEDAQTNNKRRTILDSHII